ncbi:MAG: metallopeptidase, partial [Planctomycetota bacterium]
TDHKEPRFRDSPGKGKEPHSPDSAYKDVEVLGWKLLVHEALLAEKELYKEVYDEVHHQLFRITKVIPEDKVKLLQQVPIWVELKNPWSGNCQYHPSRSWLENNGYLPEKANAVELSDAKRFVRTSQRTQPFVLLHELAHAYHDLQLGFNHKGIIECYKKAKEAGSYDQVLHIVGRKVKAYAMVDHTEYFAEATEAFFGTNDHYPFVKAELKEHDPEMFEMLREVWGLKK